MTRISFATALLALSLAACGDSSFNADRLTPAEVAGTYSVCRLSFVPENGILPVANLLDSVMDLTPPAGRPAPSLALSGSQQRYDLVYTRQSDGFLRQLQGETGLDDAEVTVRFFEDEAGAVASESLLPRNVEFAFHDAPRRLTDTTGFYTVRRADYAAAAGVNESGLQDRINGRLEAALQVGSCP